MVELIQILILIFGVFAITRVFINISDKNLSKLESFFWLIFWSLVMVVTLFPILIIWFSSFLGVGRGVDLAVYSTLIILAYMIFRLYAKLTLVEKKITKIVRTISLKKK